MKKSERKDMQLKRFSFDPKRDKVVSDLGIDKKHPYFESRADKSVETLKRVGFPEELVRILQERMKK